MGIFDKLFGRGRSDHRDGHAPDTAVSVNSVEEEYAWMQKNFPGYRMIMQSLEEIDGKPYDVLTWQNNRGEKQTIYFDISNFYEEFDVVSFAKTIGSSTSTSERQWKGPACQYCGKPLRSDKAKQCFTCGMDWRDPANIVCRKAKN